MERLLARTKGDVLFDVINVVLLSILGLLVLYPLYFVLIGSISDPDRIYAGDVWLLPKGITFEGYQRIFNDNTIWVGYRNSILYALLGAMFSVVLTITAAYPLSKKNFYGRNFFMAFFVFTMFFSGGLIPTYLLVKSLGMVNTIWAMVIPGAVGVWNVIIARTFFQMIIPDELWEAATMEGCTHTRFFLKIVIPLSMPIISVLALFTIVGQWNGFFDALIYLESSKLYPLQIILRNILIQNQPVNNMLADVDSYAAKQRVSELIKYGIILVAALPLLVLYPFLQRFFVKGVLIGSIKG